MDKRRLSGKMIRAMTGLTHLISFYTHLERLKKFPLFLSSSILLLMIAVVHMFPQSSALSSTMFYALMMNSRRKKRKIFGNVFRFYSRQMVYFFCTAFCSPYQPTKGRSANVLITTLYHCTKLGKIKKKAHLKNYSILQYHQDSDARIKALLYTCSAPLFHMD